MNFIIQMYQHLVPSTLMKVGQNFPFSNCKMYSTMHLIPDIKHEGHVH